MHIVPAGRQAHQRQTTDEQVAHDLHGLAGTVAHAVPDQIKNHMLTFGYHDGGRPENHPDVQNDGCFIGPGQGLAEAKAGGNLNQEDDEERYK